MFAGKAMLAAAPPVADAEQSYTPSEMRFTATVSAQYGLLDP
jgi:hypothetical protein